jgi:hypothetical protein
MQDYIEIIDQEGLLNNQQVEVEEEAKVQEVSTEIKQ